MAEARVPSPRSRDETNHQPRVPEQKVEVRRSQRRRRTVGARLEGDTLVVMIPARMSRAEEKHWVAVMERKLRRVESHPEPPELPALASDEELLVRCAQLSAKYLDGNVTPASVRWVPPMRTRWASCTPVDATIRVSRLLRDVPSWVLDYVLVHELAHLRVPGHNAEFWALVQRYPKSQRAMGFLEGLSSAARLNIPAED